VRLVFYDPRPFRNDYLSPTYFQPMRQWLHANSHTVIETDLLEKTHNAVVLAHGDYLTPDSIATLKNNNCKIVGFSVTDSSWITQSCRSGSVLKDVDLMFALTGIQKVNEGHEIVVDQNFNISLEKRSFLPPDDWSVFDAMRKAGRIQSLPYVHAERQPDIPSRPYSERSQKVLIRGGNHARRFVLALMLMRKDLLDTNSGFVTGPYFAQGMEPQFRYCDECRWDYEEHHRARHLPPAEHCNSPAYNPYDGLATIYEMHDLGRWNNRCPRSFYWLAEQFEKRHGAIDKIALEKLLNAQWLPAKDHLEMLARITFTSDLKWLFSIYAAQRFWDAASVGCVNLLPARTMDQDYFPVMNRGEHYIVYFENIAYFTDKGLLFTEAEYNSVSSAARALYTEWIQATDYALNTNLLRHIFEQIERHCT
jgi:hypothetical protein